MIGEVTADLFLPRLMSFIVNYGITGLDITSPDNGSELAVKLLDIFGGGDDSPMDTEDEIDEGKQCLDVQSVCGDIEFEHLNFGYEKAHPVLKDFNLSVCHEFLHIIDKLGNTAG